MSGDFKIKTAANKPPMGLIPASATIGAARVYGYGAKKYAAGNFYNATLEDGAGQRYVSAALRHLADMQLPNGLHTPTSLATLDPESGLPHIDHVLCGLMMLRTIMVKCGALEVDPGVGFDPPEPQVDSSTGYSFTFTGATEYVSCTTKPSTCDCRECEHYRLESTGELR